MARLLFWGVLALLVVWWLRKVLPRGSAPNAPPPPPAPASASTPSLESMVSCVHCGVHLPEQDAVVGAKGQHYCSVSHRAADEVTSRTP